MGIVEPLKDDAMFWYSVWISCGKPRQYTVHQIMKHTKYKYHYTNRAIKKRDADLRKSRMAECLTTEKNHRDFWKEQRKMDGNSKQIPAHVDGETEPKDIAQVFSEKYQKLYNSVLSDMDEVKAIKEKKRIDLQGYHSDEHVITVNEMNEAILMLQDDRSDGNRVL